jgi:hypothetical protein
MNAIALNSSVSIWQNPRSVFGRRVDQHHRRCRLSLRQRSEFLAIIATLVM